MFYVCVQKFDGMDRKILGGGLNKASLTRTQADTADKETKPKERADVARLGRALFR